MRYSDQKWRCFFSTISVNNSLDCKHSHILPPPLCVVSVHFKFLHDKYPSNQMSRSPHFNVKPQPQIYYIDFDFIYCGCQYSLITLFHFWFLMKYLWVMMWKNVRMRKWWSPVFSPAMTFQYYELYRTRLGLCDLFCCTHYPLIQKQRARGRKEYI